MIEKPKEGWKELTWYLVEVAYNKFNVIHRALFFSGFLFDGKPGGYNMFVSEGYGGEALSYRDAYYLKVIRVIITHEELFMGEMLLPGDRE